MSCLRGKRFPLEAKDYEILEEVGDGVCATVYRARCLPHDEIVAVKLWSLESSWDNPNTIKRDIELTGHPNLLRVHCSFVDEAYIWVVMPYLDGGSCFSIIKALYPKRLDITVIATLLHETLQALVYLHEQGHAHLNVKGASILVDSNGEVKLGDFGVLSEKHFFGTSSWMAPELRHQLDGHNIRSDIWSFGMTALELAHGHAPFANYTLMEVLLMTLKDKKFPKCFGELIGSCLLKNPNNRPTALELLQHPFFEGVTSPENLCSTLLEGLSPLGERHKALKDEEVDLRIGIDCRKETLSQKEYKQGIINWDFDREDFYKQVRSLKRI